MSKTLRLNAQIRISPIRVINQNQDQLGVIPLDEALRMAREEGLDLVEVSPTERPPVCRIMDYGKFKYDRKKKQKQASGAHTQVLKEIRIRPKTDTHDRSIKLKHAIEFLGEGRKVQFTMLFRGRERFHRDRAIDIFDGILKELGDTVKVERRPIMEGRRMTMVISPVKAGASGGPKQPKPEKKKPVAVAAPPTTPPSVETPTEVKAAAPVAPTANASVTPQADAPPPPSVETPTEVKAEATINPTPDASKSPQEDAPTPQS